MDEARSQKLRELVSQWLEREDTILLAKHKLVLKLYYVEMRPDREIADLLGLTRGKLEMLRNEAIRGLRRHKEFREAHNAIMEPDTEK